MVSLNEKIVAYLNINNISYSAGDYQTGQPEGQEDQVLIWNTEKLGIQPTQEQLDSTYETYQTNLALAEQEKINIKASAHAKLVALGLSANEIASLGA
jgi:hypothetical protein